MLNFASGPLIFSNYEMNQTIFIFNGSNCFTYEEDCTTD